MTKRLRQKAERLDRHIFHYLTKSQYSAKEEKLLFFMFDMNETFNCTHLPLPNMTRTDTRSRLYWLLCLGVNEQEILNELGD
jgi:hypothetical protein